ncbi:MAG: Rpn family recombination-promoting nuclease/putative transposase [Treponema sp.]|nr:Rpn family recombination-promoting nuclease/putative transposase [Treponema sp.]
MKKNSDEHTFSIEEFNKYWNSLTITNDYIFCKVFQDEELCRKMLEILLDVKIRHLKYPDAQKDLRASYLAKGIRLDVFTEDKNRVFDVEIQNAHKEDIPLRTRYYHSTMDTALLKKGNFYTDLKESYVIFLCKFDPLGKGQPIYTFQMRDKENPKTILGDKTYTILYNVTDIAKLKDGEKKDFLNYIAQGVNNSSFTNKIEKRVQEVKNDEDWRVEFMTLEMVIKEREREAVKRGIQRGMQQGSHARNIEIAKQMLLKNFSQNDICDITSLSLEEVKALQKS